MWYQTFQFQCRNTVKHKYLAVIATTTSLPQCTNSQHNSDRQANKQSRAQFKIILGICCQTNYCATAKAIKGGEALQRSTVSTRAMICTMTAEEAASENEAFQ
jgi:hypothetical protein